MVKIFTHAYKEALVNAQSMTSLVLNALREISILMTLPWLFSL